MYKYFQQYNLLHKEIILYYTQKLIANITN